MSSRGSKSIKGGNGHVFSHSSSNSHRFLVGPPLVVISLFCFGFVLVHPHGTHSVSSHPLSSRSSQRKILQESTGTNHIDKLNEAPSSSSPASSSSSSSITSQNQKNQAAGSGGNSSAHSDQSPANNKNQQDQSKNLITPLVNKLTKQL